MAIGLTLVSCHLKERCLTEEGAGDVALMVEHLHGVHRAMGKTSSATERKKLLTLGWFKQKHSIRYPVLVKSSLFLMCVSVLPECSLCPMCMSVA